MSSEGESTTGGRRGWRLPVVVGVATVLVLLAVGVAVTYSSRGDQAVPTPGPSQSAQVPATYSSVADMVSQNPFYVAHRGGSAQWPEMSMLAYTNAAAWGIGALEVSVARTKDGVYFGLHDKTLDRTSEVTGDIDPTTLTWAELSTTYRNKLNAPTPDGVPYVQVSEIFDKFASNHVIFVDTKYIGDPAQRAELIEQMLSAAPADHWVLKGYYDNESLTELARDEGIESWGYYYARDLDIFDSTAGNWDLLGLEIGASQAEFATVKARGKPVIAFFISGTASLAEATEKGANGMMVSDVPATFGSPKLAGS
jgi:hypothetical protein